jgi:poly(hydroxyalkanoate) granule-associated protein
MVKKLKAMAEKKNAAGAGLFDSALASSVRASAKEIWLAGMGAFAKAQAEGKQVFEALVKEGNSLQKKTQGAAEEKFSEVTSKMTSHRQGRPTLGQARVDLRTAHRQGAEEAGRADVQ